MPDRSRIDRCVLLEFTNEACVVSINLDVRMPLGLRVHHGERDAAIRMLMRRSTGSFSRTSRSCVFDRASRQDAQNLVEALRERLFRIARKPISQRQVEDILGITSRERIRWGKDGRLPLSGTSRIRKGKTGISLWTYPGDAVEQLAANPAVIRRWREEDEATTAIGLAAIIV
ncbi:MAG: hypothetical protein ACOY4P_05130 [Pseudomonadota bacterium]